MPDLRSKWSRSGDKGLWPFTAFLMELIFVDFFKNIPYNESDESLRSWNLHKEALRRNFDLQEGHMSVFISYRRKGGSRVARKIYRALSADYEVFMDEKSLKSGFFQRL